MDQNQAVLETLLSISSEAIIGVNEALEIILFNAGAEQIFGYTQADALGKSLAMLIPDGYHQDQSNQIINFIASGELTDQVDGRRLMYGKRKNGEIFPMQGSLARRQSAQGTILAVILRDISEQQRLEERLQKLSVVVEQTPASVVITDTDGLIEYVNPAFERASGYALAEVLGKRTSILKSGLTPPELYQDMWRTITSGEVWSGEICNRKKNGELYWELGSVSPIRNPQGVITNYISVKEDITERKKNEQELNRYRRQLEELVQERTAALRAEIEERQRTEMRLREKEHTLNLALHTGQVGTWEYDIQSEEIHWSDAVYQIFGISPSNTRITYQMAKQMIHPDDQALLPKAWDNSDADCQSHNMDLRIGLLDGQERMINLTIAPMCDDQGGLIKVIGTVQDITERVRIQAELLEKERMTNELSIGRQIQLSMLPKTSPTVEGWSFAGFYQPASQVGGDFYDFLKLPDGKIGLIIGDVSGKGLPAALSMALSRAIIRTNAFRNGEPRAALLRSNEILYHDYYNGGFVTALYAILDPRKGTVEIANAGHNPPLWFEASSQQAQTIKPHGMALGLYPTIQINPAKVTLLPGDVLVCYTDGLTDAINAQGDFHDAARLVETVVANSGKSAAAGKSAAEILEAILHAWNDFVCDLPQEDDLTLIVAKRL